MLVGGGGFGVLLVPAVDWVWLALWLLCLALTSLVTRRLSCVEPLLLARCPGVCDRGNGERPAVEESSSESESAAAAGDRIFWERTTRVLRGDLEVSDGLSAMIMSESCRGGMMSGR